MPSSENGNDPKHNGCNKKLRDYLATIILQIIKVFHADSAFMDELLDSGNFLCHSLYKISHGFADK